MKQLLNGFVMSLTMFSIIPMTQRWDDKASCIVIPSFPLVGTIIGGLWYGLSLFLTSLEIPLMLSTALLLLFPLMMSGFIHIDGYMDTSDAMFSRVELAKKRAILKDSHVGAFAVIMLGCYFILGFSSVYGMLERNVPTLAFLLIPILSRSLAGTALLNIKPISKTGFGATFRQNTRHVHTGVVVCFGIACLVVGYLLGGLTVLLPLSALLLGGLLSTVYIVKQLDGISGDLCGFIITVSELCALLALAVI